VIRRALGLVAAGLAAASGTFAVASEPRSAIPWLSESIRTDVPAPAPRPTEPTSSPTRGSEEITVTPLGTVRRDAVGLLPPEQTGLARDLWGPAAASRVESLIRDYPDEGVPAARAIFRKILLAETDPPQSATGDGTLLVTRIDRLLEMGALEEARALIELAGPETPELFRRWFDIGLLIGAPEAPCDALRQNPTLSPTLPARVFCLARGGDWNAAEITLVVGEDVGSINADQQALLARFLDPEIFEGEPDPPVPDPLTPLDFLMREAVGMPRPPGALPLAFLYHDLVEHAPMRARIEAAERLVLSGGIAPQDLFEAYRAGTPPASGGIWERAALVQALDAALAEGADPRIAAASMIAAERALRTRGLDVAFAREYAPALADADWSGLEGPALDSLIAILLLGGETPAAARLAGGTRDGFTRTLLTLAGAGGNPAPASDLQRAALSGLVAVVPADERETQLAGLADSGRRGEAVLGALSLLGNGETADPPALQTALFALRRAGLEPDARAIALQMVLREEAGLVE
jgi:hypothetical protein